MKWLDINCVASTHSIVLDPNCSSYDPIFSLWSGAHYHILLLAVRHDNLSDLTYHKFLKATKDEIYRTLNKVRNKIAFSRIISIYMWLLNYIVGKWHVSGSNRHVILSNSKYLASMHKKRALSYVAFELHRNFAFSLRAPQSIKRDLKFLQYSPRFLISMTEFSFLYAHEQFSLSYLTKRMRVIRIIMGGSCKN